MNLTWPVAAVLLGVSACVTLAYCWRVYVRNRYTNEPEDERS